MPLHQLRLFLGIYLFSKESRIQYSYLAHDENPIQFVHPFIFHSDWHSCCAYKWYISFSHVFTADLLSILHVCFLDRIDLADSIHPTIFTRHHAIDYDRLAVDHVDVADIMEPEPV